MNDNDHTSNSHDDKRCREVCSSDNAIKLYVKALRTHDRVEAVCHWGCNMVYALSCWSEGLRKELGRYCRASCARTL